MSAAAHQQILQALRQGRYMNTDARFLAGAAGQQRSHGGRVCTRHSSAFSSRVGRCLRQQGERQYSLAVAKCNPPQRTCQVRIHLRSDYTSGCGLYSLNDDNRVASVKLKDVRPCAAVRTVGSAAAEPNFAGRGAGRNGRCSGKECRR